MCPENTLAPSGVASKPYCSKRPMQRLSAYVCRPPCGVQGYEENSYAELADVMRGAAGYICVTPRTACLEENTSLKVSLYGMKDMLVKTKAWESNRRAYIHLKDAQVPVIYMSTGRPQEKIFGATDRLIGLFRSTALDVDILSCALSPCQSECGSVTAELAAANLLSEDLLLDGAAKNSRKRGARK